MGPSYSASAQAPKRRRSANKVKTANRLDSLLGGYDLATLEKRR
jgi:hypothetical protein